MSKLFFEWQKATPEHCKARWSCAKPGVRFRCGFCGNRIQEGEEFKAIYTNDMLGYGGNPLCCQSCKDTNEALREKWKVLNDEYNAFVKQPRFWRFLPEDEQ